MRLIASIFGQEIGILKEEGENIFFEYFSSFKGDELKISPLSLPQVAGRTYTPSHNMSANGLPGVFADSLPDSFGNHLMYEYFREKHGQHHINLTTLQKLSYIGANGIGAIEYTPAEVDEDYCEVIELRKYVNNIKDAINGDANEVIKNEILRHPSPGGARPKAALLWDRKNNIMSVGNKPSSDHYEYWIVKFDEDKKETTKIEKTYFDIASLAGLNVPKTELIHEGDEVHFAIKRFDRVDDEKLHQHTLSGLLHKDYMQHNSVSYEQYLRAVKAITGSHEEVKEGFRRMVFNVVSKNCDDHTKNFSFLMNSDGVWSVSPAYDLVYSNGDATFGEHKMSINKKNKDISIEDIAYAGYSLGLDKAFMVATVNKIVTTFDNFSEIAQKNGLSDNMRKEIQKNINLLFGDFPEHPKNKHKEKRNDIEAGYSILRGMN